MKLSIYYVLIFIFFSFPNNQEKYPNPPKKDNTLFYIQHSDNHNTFVYEAKFSGSNLDSKNPVNTYRIVYTEGGIIKPLTTIQKKMAYGIDTKMKSLNVFEMYLVVAKDVKLFLFLDEASKPKVWTEINNKKIILNRIFVQIKKGNNILKPDVDHVVFEGNDFISGNKIKLVKNID